MILQEEFQKSGYTDLLTVEAASEYGIDLEELYDVTERPPELMSIFISAQRDELFFLLYENPRQIRSLCDRWDDRIRVFAIINGSNPAFKKLKYNIVQLIVYSGDAPDRSREGDLQITRKILLNGDLTGDGRIEISDDDAIELPFHMIPPDEFAPDREQLAKLDRLLPDADLLPVLKEQKELVKKKRGAAVQPKYYTGQQFEKIKEWLER